MLHILRNMFRRKGRTFLTIFGIVIGIYALTVMGGMAEKMNQLISGGRNYYQNQISILPKGSFGMGLLPYQKVREIKKIEGVRLVREEIMLSLSDDSHMSFGMPEMIMGLKTEQFQDNDMGVKMTFLDGNWWEEKERSKVVLGSDLVNKFKAEVGDKVTIQKKEFEVVGLLDKTTTAPDKIAFINIADARDLLIANSPFLKTLGDQELLTEASVLGEEDVDMEKLAQRIEKKVKDIAVTSPQQMLDTFDQASLIFNLIIIGSALIALIVGSLSVINTMIMSVSERVKEIGIKRAVGARTRHILIEYLAESGVIGLAGGLVGLGLGSLTVLLVNYFTRDLGVVIFAITPRLAIGAVVFATVLGIVAGIYPAWRAAKLDPVKALRGE